MSRNVRCPRCNTLLAVPSRVGAARMTCSVCLAPVGLVQDPFPAEPLPPRAPRRPEPEVLYIEDSNAEDDVYRNAMISRVISGVLMFLLMVGFPMLAVDKLGPDSYALVFWMGLILSAAIGLSQKEPVRPASENLSTSTRAIEGAFSLLSVIAVGLAQALLGLLLTGALLFFLLFITCVGMK